MNFAKIYFISLLELWAHTSCISDSVTLIESWEEIMTHALISERLSFDQKICSNARRTWFFSQKVRGLRYLAFSIAGNSSSGERYALSAKNVQCELAFLLSHYHCWLTLITWLPCDPFHFKTLMWVLVASLRLPDLLFSLLPWILTLIFSIILHKAMEDSIWIFRLSFQLSLILTITALMCPEVWMVTWSAMPFWNRKQTDRKNS